MSYRHRELKKTCSVKGCVNQVVNMRSYDPNMVRLTGTLLNKDRCSHCNFWINQFNHPYAVISWANNKLWHYRLCSNKNHLKGFYGALWSIKSLNTGETVEWDNVWSQGEIPEHLHEKFLNSRPLVEMTIIRHGR